MKYKNKQFSHDDLPPVSLLLSLFDPAQGDRTAGDKQQQQRRNTTRSSKSPQAPSSEGASKAVPQLTQVTYLLSVSVEIPV